MKPLLIIAMKKIVLFIVCVVHAVFSSAQYCSTRKGQKLYYDVLFDGKKSEVHSVISDVTNRNDSCIVTVQDFFSDMSNSFSIENVQFKDTVLLSSVVYSKGNTLVYLQDGETDKANMISMLSGMLDKKDMSKAKDNLDMKGQIILVLNDKVKKGDKITPCEMVTKIGPMSITTSMEGRYAGFEEISTAAGKFYCAKVTYTLKMKMLMFTETVDVTAWYAMGVGLVKEIEKSKKMNKTTEKTLKKIENTPS